MKCSGSDNGSESEERREDKMRQREELTEGGMRR